MLQLASKAHSSNQLHSYIQHFGKQMVFSLKQNHIYLANGYIRSFHDLYSYHKVNID